MKYLWIWLLIGHVSLQAQNLYVDGAGGNDNNSGTALADAWKTIGKAFDAATPGSTVFIRGGTYHENVYATLSGTPAAPITFTNYNNEAVFLDGTGTPDNDMLYLENCNHLIIKNLSIQNKVVNFATGVVISATPNGGSQNIRLQNLRITGINWTSNSSQVPTSNKNSNPLVVYGEGNNQANAITNVVITDCEIFNNITGFSEALALDGNVDTFTLSNNRVHHNSNIGIDMAGNYNVSSGSATDQARNGRCINNICYNNVSNYATSAGIYVDGGRDIVIEGNQCYENGWGIEIGCEENGTTSGIIVRNNLIYNNKEAGLAIGGYNPSTSGKVLNSYVVNNSFLKNDYSSSGTGELYMSKMSDCTIANNIFYMSSQKVMLSKDPIQPFANNRIDYNCWFNSDFDSAGVIINWNNNTLNSFATYRTQTGFDSNSIFGDPLFLNSDVSSPVLSIVYPSICIDAGDSSLIAVAGNTDFYLNNRVNNIIDIGAVENTNSTSVPVITSALAKVYPNPFSSYLTVSSDILPAQFSFVNSLGCLVHTIALTEKHQTIQADLPAGLYHYMVIAKDRMIQSGSLIHQP